jgi:hypothetical protein
VGSSMGGARDGQNQLSADPDEDGLGLGVGAVVSRSRTQWGGNLILYGSGVGIGGLRC